MVGVCSHWGVLYSLDHLDHLDHTLAPRFVQHVWHAWWSGWSKWSKENLYPIDAGTQWCCTCACDMQCNTMVGVCMFPMRCWIFLGPPGPLGPHVSHHVGF